MKNPSTWQEESIVVPTFYIDLFSPKITNLRKQQAPNAATSESNEGRPTCLSVDVGQYVDQVSADTSVDISVDISAECRSPYSR